MDRRRALATFGSLLLAGLAGCFSSEPTQVRVVAVEPTRPVPEAVRSTFDISAQTQPSDTDGRDRFVVSARNAGSAEQYVSLPQLLGTVEPTGVLVLASAASYESLDWSNTSSSDVPESHGFGLAWRDLFPIGTFLGPGQSVTHTLLVDVISRGDRPIAPGTYTLEGGVTVVDRPTEMDGRTTSFPWGVSVRLANRER